MLSSLTEGQPVSYKNQFYRIKSAVNLSKVLLVNKYGETIVTSIADLKPAEQCVFAEVENNNIQTIEASNFMDLPEEIWKNVKFREENIKSLLESKSNFNKGTRSSC